MSDLSRRDVVNILQQNNNLVFSRSASKQDVQEVISYLSQRMCSKQDIQSVLDRYRDRNGERLCQSVQEQMAFMRQLAVNLDSFSGRLERIESRIVELQASTQAIRVYNELKYKPRQIPLEGNRTDSV